MLYNIDINECINKYLNCDNILLLRQTFKKNNEFRILKDLKVIRNINISDKVLFNNDEYLLKVNLYTDDILEYSDLEKNNIDIINKICYINIKKKIETKKSLNRMCEFLKNLNNMDNLHTINLNTFMVSSLNRYLYKENINLFNNLENLIIDASYLEECNILHYSNIIIEFLKKINIKNLYFIKYNSKFESIFKSYYNYTYGYENNNFEIEFL
tara:strand:+ start:3057 stop:3695 length:639 start_codon:yes stop_codon:yes gene_type:complete